MLRFRSETYVESDLEDLCGVVLCRCELLSGGCSHAIGEGHALYHIDLSSVADYSELNFSFIHYHGLPQMYVPLRNVTLPRPRRAGVCGGDKSPASVVYAGYARIETYPWLGTLYYITNDRRYSTSVVLVTTQIVIGAAMDIDRLPKIDIRTNSRVILGANCTGEGIGVRDYTYHPDFNKASYSALALIQLETKYWMRDLTPICRPPAPGEIRKPQFFAMAQSDDCRSSLIKIHKMSYFDQEQCKMYYRRSELDVEKMWPTHTICAKAQAGPECVWENGAVLVIRQDNKWHLLGFGIYGPGCSAPARFLDYASYRPWVRSSIARIGMPTVTRLADNHLILRRSLTNVQRFGPCDPEEVRAELFTDRTVIQRGPTAKKQRFTIFSNLEYSCIAFRSYVPKTPKWLEKPKPYIRLKRWCLSPREICYNSKYLQIDFAIEIYFHETVVYRVMVYGREIRIIDRKKLMSHINKKKPYVEISGGVEISEP